MKNKQEKTRHQQSTTSKIIYKIISKIKYREYNLKALKHP